MSRRIDWPPPARRRTRRWIAAIAAALLPPCLPAAQAQQAPRLPVAAPARAIPVTDGLAAPDAATVATLPRYLAWRSARFVDWLSDGSLLIATRFGDTEQIHRVRAPLAMREQESFAPSGVLAAAARPHASDAFVYVAVHGGGTQLFLARLDTHALRALTDGSARDGDPSWAPGGQHLAFTSDRRDGVDVDVYLLDVDAPAATPRLIAGGDGNRWQIDDWSPDGHRLLLGRRPSAGEATPGSVADADARRLARPGTNAGLGLMSGDSLGAAPPPTEIYLLDVDSDALTPLAAPAQGARHGDRRGRGAPAPALPVRAVAARFAADGRGIVLLTHAASGDGPYGADREFLHLVYADPTGGRWHDLSAPDAHDVELFDQSADGRYLAYTVDDDGGSRLMLVDQRLQLTRAVTTLPPGVISSLEFDPAGTHLALTLQSARSPSDVYVLDPAGGVLTRWTASESGPLDGQSLVEPRLLHFSTWDRVDGVPRQLAVWAYAAAAGPGTGTRPVVIWLCSGAGFECRPGFAPFVQYLARELGAVVLAPQVRGSSGQRLALQDAGAGPLRADAVRDVGSMLVWIGLQPGLDGGHVALLGEGYGAYLALASLSKYGDRLAGAVAAFPPPLRDLPNVLAIRRPVLLVQGLADPFVPAYLAAQLREGLRAQGVDVQYLAAADQPQDFRRRADRDAYHLAAASFLAQLLR